MKKGIDTLALLKMKKLIAEELPTGWYYSSFIHINKPTWGSPKKAWEAIKYVADAKRAGGCRNHSIWEDNHTYNKAKHDKLIFADLKKHNDLKQKYSELDIYFSPFCEHNIKGDQLKRLMAKLVEGARGITIVNSIHKGDIITDGSVINEIHHIGTRVPKGKYVISYDGQEMRDRNVPDDMKKHAAAHIFFGWTSWCNGRYTIALDKNNKPKDPTPRDKRIDFLSEKKLDGIVRLMMGKVDVKLNKNVIFKAFSDDHGIKKADPKSNKPVILAPKGKNVKLVTASGQLIHEFEKPRPWEGGGIRSYAKIWGFELQDKARRLTGDTVAYVIIDGKSQGTVDPAHRENGWR